MLDDTAASTEASRLLQVAGDLYEARRVHEAIALFERVLQLGLPPDEGAGERWMCYMLAGRFEDAWREGDRVIAARLRSGETCHDRPLHERWVWDGSRLDGEHVLVRCYHGLGDCIQFLRYVPLLAKRARSVAVQAPGPLLELLQTLEGVDRLFPLEAEPAGHTVEVEATELPHAFRTVLGTVPGSVPYLSADPARTAVYRRRMTSDSIRVGLVWASGLWRPERNIPLHLLRGLAAIPGVSLHCLQRGPCVEEARQGSAPAFSDPGNESDDVMETAALVDALDVVISTDTMVAHLAGALGKPVWTMLQFAADWRWLASGETSPWYPTMRLFRQPAPGDWGSVAEEITAALAQRMR